LSNEIKIKWTDASRLSSKNETVRDHEWDVIDYDNGVVAVSKEWASEKGLPMGASFPWDTSKAIYLVNAHHNLHCLVSASSFLAARVLNIAEKHIPFVNGIPQRLPTVLSTSPHYSLLGRAGLRCQM